MLTALIGLLGVIVGVLVSVQLIVAARERKLESRRSARLLFADQLHATSAIEFLLEHDAWWSDEMAPPLEGWRRHSFAGAMEGVAFLDVDGAFYRVAALERSRNLGVPPADARDDAQAALQMLEKAGDALLIEGFRRSSRVRMARAMMHGETAQDAPSPGDEE